MTAVNQGNRNNRAFGWIAFTAVYSGLVVWLRPLPLERWEFWFFLLAAWGSISIVHAFVHRRSFRLGVRLLDEPRHRVPRALVVAVNVLWLAIFPFSGQLGTWG